MRGLAAFFTVVKDVRPDGFVELRLILDMRRVNEAFRRPPWTALSGPGSLRSLEFSEEATQGYEIRGAGGDVKNFFYWVKLTSFLATFFGIEDVTPSELHQELTRQGWPGAMPDRDKAHLMVTVTPMGWSWAVWVA